MEVKTMKLSSVCPVQDYVWNAIVVYWHDGDTVALDVDRCFEMTQRQHIRLAGINTPELIGPQAVQAQQAKVLAETIAPAGSKVIMRSHRPDKYGRWLGEIWCNGQCVNTALLAAGLAVEMQ